MRLANTRFPQKHEIEVGGKLYPCTAPVISWRDSGLEFSHKKPGSRRRCHKTAIDLGVGHWTAGENDIPTLVRVLENRQLAIEFANDHDGVIWQFCDPLLVDTFDAGPVNRRSYGFEVVNHGFRSPGRSFTSHPLGKKRTYYTAQLHGKSREFSGFFPRQVAGACALADTLAFALGTVPRMVPEDAEGNLITRQLTAAELRNYRGMIGHYHITASKSDPGTDLLLAMQAHFRKDVPWTAPRL